MISGGFTGRVFTTALYFCLFKILNNVNKQESKEFPAGYENVFDVSYNNTLIPKQNVRKADKPGGIHHTEHAFVNRLDYTRSAIMRVYWVLEIMQIVFMN